MWSGKPHPLELAVEQLLQANRDLSSEITRLAGIIAEASLRPEPLPPPIESWVRPDWDTNPDWDELEAQRKASTQETIEELQEKLGDHGFLNSEISFDN